MYRMYGMTRAHGCAGAYMYRVYFNACPKSLNTDSVRKLFNQQGLIHSDRTAETT